jgi:hypothetical protein
MHEGNSVLNKIKMFIRNIKGIVFTGVLLCAVILLFITAVGGASEKADSSAISALERAIRRAAVQCYAIEGFYPIELDYLVEHYGVIIDEARFAIYYQADTPNFMPVIIVKRHGADD